METKEFDLAQAKAGAKVVTRAGRPVRILCFDQKAARPLRALITIDYEGEETEYSQSYYEDGKACHNQVLESSDDLVMLVEEDDRGQEQPVVTNAPNRIYLNTWSGTMTDGIEITKESVLAAYNGASDEQKQLLETLFGKDTFKPQDITGRVRTFEDACNELGPDHPLVVKYYQWADNVEDNDPFIRAVLKLVIITAALNEGWEPHFTAGELRWIPWFWLYKSREDWENVKDEGWRNEHPYRELGGDYKTEYAGFACAISIDSPSSTVAYVGSRLCFKNSDLAAYSGTQFADLWMDYFLVLKSDNLINGEE